MKHERLWIIIIICIIVLGTWYINLCIKSDLAYLYNPTYPYVNSPSEIVVMSPCNLSQTTKVATIKNRGSGNNSVSHNFIDDNKKNIDKNIDDSDNNEHNNNIDDERDVKQSSNHFVNNNLDNVVGKSYNYNNVSLNNVRNKDYMNLFNGIRYHDIDYVKKMVRQGVDINQFEDPETHSSNAISVSAHLCKLDMLEYFMEQGVNPDFYFKDNASGASIFELSHSNTDNNSYIISKIKEYIVSYNIKKLENLDPKLADIFKNLANDEGIPEILYMMFTNYNSFSFSTIYTTFPRNTTPLMIASYFGYKDLVKFFIKGKYPEDIKYMKAINSINNKNVDGFTAYTYAFINNKDDIIKILRNSGINIQEK